MPQIEYAFLADAAQVQPGQKFSVLGGGVTRLTGPSIPFQHPHLSLVVGVRMTAAERNREHELEFSLLAPDGAVVASSTGRIVARGPNDPNDFILTLAIDLWNLVLNTAGEYSVRILVGGSERKRLSLTVAQSRGEPAGEQQRYLQ